MTEKKYRYSEIFGGFGYYDEDRFIPGTVQGEGKYTGITSAWLRVWGCNFSCEGFGQECPMDPSTYVLPYKDLDMSQYKSMEELPMIDKGCDSSFSWSLKFKDLAYQETADQITDKILKRVNGSWQHPTTKEECHFVITGGEPVLSQSAVVAVLDSFEKKHAFPRYVTIETNGSLALRQNFSDYIKRVTDCSELRELFWSVSPKIFATSGERPENAIRPDIVKSYSQLSNHGQLKFVCNGSKESWDQIDQAIESYRSVGVEWPVWIMPVGATIEGQNLVAADIADQAIFRGHKVAVRAHVYLYQNQMGR